MENQNWENEKKQVIETLSNYVDFNIVPCGKSPRTILNVEKRDPMYGGNGVVYMLSLFEKGELVNNRIGNYMILMNKGDQAGFHEHASRNEQELYVIVSGEALYEEKKGQNGGIRQITLKKGNVTSTHADYYHSVTNTGDAPLIIFVITTNEPNT